MGIRPVESGIITAIDFDEEAGWYIYVDSGDRVWSYGHIFQNKKLIDSTTVIEGEGEGTNWELTLVDLSGPNGSHEQDVKAIIEWVDVDKEYVRNVYVMDVNLDTKNKSWNVQTDPDKWENVHDEYLDTPDDVPLDVTNELDFGKSTCKGKTHLNLRFKSHLQNIINFSM